ncbi:Uncharacterized conserved protein PhnB, glyoxalase superfamily [Paracoccus isoporae]|uniref:Uncharacterized conserved protein PhnB, glyoxalase superfamily n=1 Tax=Paracoccus isoporae TaxID=591205 RepID=A0A1G6Z0I4_9RHOB|nr:VOC family protein [Paracoccus isoporae]SDD96120.1 Uncharacterized conserved protein PhnB, glyoxalase superfamily [Paracoccus isoporae]
MYKPASYPDLSPYLIVSDAGAVLEFAQSVFGAEALRVQRGEDGEVIHAETRIGDSVVMVGQADLGGGAHLHLYLDDPEAVYARALSAGAEAVQPLEPQKDGDRRGGFRDPSGTTWWVASAG